jgi:transcriptional regulator with XRE-family HTH domain
MSINNKLTEDVRKRLVIFRKSKKITQDDIAAAFGINQPAYSQYENGKNKMLSKAKQTILKDRFGLNIDWLFTGIGEMIVCDKQKNNDFSEHDIEEKGKKITIDYSEYMELKGQIKEQMKLIYSQQKTIEANSRTIDNLTKKNGNAGAV